MRFLYLKERPDALPLVARWYVEQWGHLKPDRTIEMMQKELHAYLNSARIPLLVLAVTGETVMGAAQLKLREMTIYPDKEHWLGGVYIAAAYRGKGAATRMVRHMVKLARELGVATLHLQTDDLRGGI
jgi:GNAT superfamily N-acetyltransferase